MKKFRFRLEKVLGHRARVCEEKRSELAKRNFELQEQRDHLNQLGSSLLGNDVKSTGVMREQDFFMANMYAVRLQHEIELQKKSIDEQERKVQAALNDYREARRDQAALEKLKDRKLREYKEYVAKEEEKFLDELVIQRRSNDEG